MLLKALIVAVILGFTILFLIAVFDVVLRVMDTENEVVTNALNDTAKKINPNATLKVEVQYTPYITQLVKSFTWLAGLIVAGAALVYAIHTKRR